MRMAPRVGMTLGLMLLASWVVVGGRAAAESPLDDFFGRFVGTAITQSNYPTGTDMFRNRDLDVEIKPVADGAFSIDWTTVIRGRRSDDIRRRSQSITFTPTGKPNLWRGSESADLLDGGAYSWARLDGRTLYVYVLALGEEGGLDAAVYIRQLIRDLMALQFRRIGEGRETLFVHGSLRRAD